MTISTLSANARVRVRKPARDVFNAFVDPAQMSRFWFTRRDNGLAAGKPATWALGDGDDAFAFDVQVIELVEPEKLAIEWVGPDGHATRFAFTFEDAGDGNTILAVQETGFQGDTDAVIARVLDSTGGFNQVVIAAKAWIEHGVALNVVADHV